MPSTPISRRASLTESSRDGWFHTGDLGLIDAKGRLHVLGRKEDAISRGGRYIRPLEIEDVLTYGVRDVVYRATQVHLNRPVALKLVTTPGQSLATIADSLRAEARTVVPFDQLDLLVNGAVVAAKETSGNRVYGQVETDWEVAGSAWVAARCWGRVAGPLRRRRVRQSWWDTAAGPIR